jgi:hypothetical protein
MRRVATGVAAALIGLLASANAARAQGAEFLLGGGIDNPLSTFNDGFKTGYHGLAGVSFSPPASPVGIQVDGTYSQYKDDTPLDIKEQLIYGTANVVWKFPTAAASMFHPYLIGGGGVYNFKEKGNDALSTSSETKFGINVGAGFDISAGAAALFAEGRFHDVFISDVPNLKFIPITVGVRFGG